MVIDTVEDICNDTLYISCRPGSKIHSRSYRMPSWQSKLDIHKRHGHDPRQLCRHPASYLQKAVDSGHLNGNPAHALKRTGTGRSHLGTEGVHMLMKMQVKEEEGL